MCLKWLFSEVSVRVCHSVFVDLGNFLAVRPLASAAGGGQRGVSLPISIKFCSFLPCESGKLALCEAPPYLG